jgi:hypothetical protein
MKPHRLYKVILWVFCPLLTFATALPVHTIVNISVNTLLDQVDDNVLDNECHTAQNTCSLRAAVMQANRFTRDNVVHIYVPAGIYVLNAPSGSDGETVGDLDLYQTAGNNPSVALSGVGAGLTIIDPDHHGRAFQIGSGREVYLIDIAIRNGINPGNGADSGGAISNEGYLTLSGCVLENNSALYELARASSEVSKAHPERLLLPKLHQCPKVRNVTRSKLRLGWTTYG